MLIALLTFAAAALVSLVRLDQADRRLDRSVRVRQGLSPR